jgi:hypothetical protein
MTERDAPACTSIRRLQAFALAPVTGRSFRMYGEAPSLRPSSRERERDASACISRLQAFALDPEMEEDTQMQSRMTHGGRKNLGNRKGGYDTEEPTWMNCLSNSVPIRIVPIIIPCFPSFSGCRKSKARANATPCDASQKGHGEQALDRDWSVSYFHGGSSIQTSGRQTRTRRRRSNIRIHPPDV